MIIVVKVNQSYKLGMNPKITAYRSWGCTKLLVDSKLRNKYKYLVVYYHKEIIATYCIHGVAIDKMALGKKDKVKFLLHETDSHCDKQLKTIVENLIKKGSQRIATVMSFCYIDDILLKENDLYIESLDCKCASSEIPLLDSKDVNYEQNDSNLSGKNFGGSLQNLPSNLWLRIKTISSGFDSFSLPHNKEAKTQIICNPDGSMEFQKEDNSSGTLKIVKNTLSTIEFNTAKNIFATFNSGPMKAIDKIKSSDFTSHVAHLNRFEIEYEAFSDKIMTKRVQHAKWNGDVLLVRRGFLKDIFDLMA